MKERKKYTTRCFVAALSIVFMIAVCACDASPEVDEGTAHTVLPATTTDISFVETESPGQDVIGAWISEDYVNSVLVLNEEYELYWVGIGGYNYRGTLGFMLEGTWSFSGDWVIFEGADYYGESVHKEIEYNAEDDVIILDGYSYTRWNIGFSGSKSIIGDWRVYRPSSEFNSFVVELYGPNNRNVDMWGDQIGFYLDGSYCARYDNGEIADEYCFGTYDKVFDGTAVQLNTGRANGLLYIKSLGCGVMILSSGQDDEASYLFYKLV